MSEILEQDSSIPTATENTEGQQQIKSVVLNLSTGILNGLVAGIATIPGTDFKDPSLKENLISTSVDLATNLYNFVNSLNFSMSQNQ
jgi:hypothetical protein